MQLLTIAAIVTQPPRPVGRKQILTPTPVETWAKNHAIPVLTFPHLPDKPWLFENEQTVIDALQPFKADIIISACFGQKIPFEIIKETKYGGLNVHPSLLPRWRGGDPVPWAILSGDHQTGVTVVTLEEKFDEGNIVAQKKLPIMVTDTSDALRTKLFIIGATLLVDALPAYIFDKSSNHLQHFNNGIMQQSSYARRFTRDDGFIPWKLIEMAMRGETTPLTIQQWNNVTMLKAIMEQSAEKQGGIPLAPYIERALRALAPWPGLWTEILFNNTKSLHKSDEKKRLKILSCHVAVNHTSIDPSNHPLLVLDTVQLEGKLPISFAQFQKSYL